MATPYPTDLAALHRHFPPHFPVPTLLQSFAEFLRGHDWGTLGCFQVTSSRWDDWGEEAGDLYPYFALFLREPEGSCVGFWLPEGQYHPNPPVVLIGSEGQLKLLGDSLSDFLDRLAQSTTSESDLDQREGKDAGTDLLRWLAQQPSIHAELHPARADFESWFGNYLTKVQKWCHQNPCRRQLGDRLRLIAGVPGGNSRAWWSASFDVVIVGSKFMMWHRRHGSQSLAPELTAGLESLFRSDRIRRAQIHPERGLWLQARVTVVREGGAYIQADFLDEPRVGELKPIVSSAEYIADLAAFPRCEFWMPDWLKERVRL